MPNKTIYVSDGDLPLYSRAQELAGGNLSAAISTAIRRYVDLEEGKREGFDEVTVRVGPGRGRKIRFTAVLLATWGNTVGDRAEIYNVYRGRGGKFVVHMARTPDWSTRDAEGRPGGWRAWLGLGDFTWLGSTGDSTLEVVDTLAALRDKVPSELYDLVAASAKQPIVEDLDI